MRHAIKHASVDPLSVHRQPKFIPQGYQEVRSNNNTVLECVLRPQQPPIPIIVGVIAAAAVIIIGLLAWWQYLTTRPRWLRERILQVGGSCLVGLLGCSAACARAAQQHIPESVSVQQINKDSNKGVECSVWILMRVCISLWLGM